jgi:hypothetical protein
MGQQWDNMQNNIESLIVQFIDFTIQQKEAENEGKNKVYNKLGDSIDQIVNEIREYNDSGHQAIKELMNYENVSVQLKSAFYTS